MKASKGSVVVQNFRDRLRLCWTYCGKRYYLYVGLADTPTNRKVAELRARQIELDMISSNFDPTLEKYKPVSQKRSQATVVELFERFVEYKSKRVYERTLAKYKGLLGQIREYFKNKSADAIADKQAESFIEWLADRLEPVTLRERLFFLRAAWEWGIKQKMVAANPWLDLAVKVPPKQRVKPFTVAEVSAIANAFRNNRYYSYYADYVEFLLGTGCRIGEVIGLKWKHVNDDCSRVWIGESLSRGDRKGTKTGRDRYLFLTERLQKLLLSRKPDNLDKEGLVFTAPKGGAIDDHNFRNRAWRSILKECGIEYRKPYNSRATFVSHALDAGMNPVDVAQLTGHNVRTLYEHYAGSIQSSPRIPDLFGDSD